MKKEIQDQFDALFAAHTQKLAQERQDKAAKEGREDAFEREFEKRCETLYTPAFAQVGEYLKAKGLKTRVEQTQQRRGRDGTLQHQRGITLRLLIGDEDRNYPEHEQPHLSLICDKGQQLIHIIESTTTLQSGGHSKTVASVEIQQLTDEFLQQKVLALLQEVLRSGQ